MNYELKITIIKVHVLNTELQSYRELKVSVANEKLQVDFNKISLEIN